MDRRTSKFITIFEGPDGGGKSTIARQYAEDTDARYVHFGPLPQVGKTLARLYVEAMLPALLGYQDVVMDRCWLSEMPYGITFREGEDRLGDTSRRMLERLALRCGAMVVLCQPPWEQMRENYLKRREQEYLKDVSQLAMVCELYQHHSTALPTLVYDYTDKATSPLLNLTTRDTCCHPLNIASAGNWAAPTVLVGERFAEVKDCDSLYQAPFISFSKTGCSQWLTEQLAKWGVAEDQLLWLNADQDTTILQDHPAERVIALGSEASRMLYELGIDAVKVPHPQYQKRFSSTQSYVLRDYLPARR